MKIAKYRFHIVLYTGIIAFLFSVQTHADKEPSVAIAQLLKTSRTDMIFVQGGAFTMGALNPNINATTSYVGHQVTLSSYYISKDNINYGEYDIYTQSVGQPYIDNDMKQNNYFARAENQPVMGVTWYQAHDYCAWLAKETGVPYALPTEAQWEYAARNRGNPNWAFPTDNGKLKLGVNFPSFQQLTTQSQNITGSPTPLPIGSIPCTPMGICGLAGAVNEWVNDWYQSNYNPKPTANPQGPASGVEKVVRGGAANGDPQYSNTLNRAGQDPNKTWGGFRCVINSTTSPDKLGAFASGYPK